MESQLYDALDRIIKNIIVLGVLCVLSPLLLFWALTFLPALTLAAFFAAIYSLAKGFWYLIRWPLRIILFLVGPLVLIFVKNFRPPGAFDSTTKSNHKTRATPQPNAPHTRRSSMQVETELDAIIYNRIQRRLSAVKPEDVGNRHDSLAYGRDEIADQQSALVTRNRSIDGADEGDALYMGGRQNLSTRRGSTTFDEEVENRTWTSSRASSRSGSPESGRTSTNFMSRTGSFVLSPDEVLRYRNRSQIFPPEFDEYLSHDTPSPSTRHHSRTQSGNSDNLGNRSSSSIQSTQTKPYGRDPLSGTAATSIYGLPIDPDELASRRPPTPNHRHNLSTTSLSSIPEATSVHQLREEESEYDSDQPDRGAR